MNAAIWSICKWDNIDQHDKHAVTLKLYVNILQFADNFFIFPFQVF